MSDGERGCYVVGEVMRGRGKYHADPRRERFDPRCMCGQRLRAGGRGHAGPCSYYKPRRCRFFNLGHSRLSLLDVIGALGGRR
jgi:hypothetical protein